MNIQKTQIENNMERKLVTNSILNTPFLRGIRKNFKSEYLKTSFSRTVMKWVLDYYDNFGKAPAKDIQDIYLSYKLQVDKEDADLIGTFLTSLSDTATEIQNISFAIEEANNYLRLRSCEVLAEAITLSLQHKDYVEVENLISKWNKVTTASSKSIDVMRATHAIIDAFSMEEETLFEFASAFGKMVGPVKRGDFFAFLARLKAGKSFAMLHTAVQAMLAGLKVLYVNLEMTEPQLLRRIYQGLTFSPKRDKIVDIPYFYQDKPDEPWKIGKNSEFRKAFVPTEESLEKFRAEYAMYFPNGGFRILTLPSKTHTVKELRHQVQNIAFYEDFQPDVIVLDYADLLKVNGNDYRIGLGHLWAELRGWATEDNIAIITASQSNRSSLNVAVVDASHVSEDLSKLAHVSGCVSINGTKAEMENGIWRLSHVAQREGQCFTDQVITLNSWDVAASVLDSRWISEVEYVLPKEQRDEKDSA